MNRPREGGEMTETLCTLGDAPVNLIELIPPNIKEGIDNYTMYGQPTGGFLHAVLSNDLRGAIGRADDASLAAIQYIVQYLFSYVPSSVQGSKANVSAHLEKGRELRDKKETA